jgi:tRNA(Ile)-lysidine synthase
MNAEELREQVIAQLPDAPIVVALGGGADSAVAAWACARHLPVRAVFVDHAMEEALLASALTLAEDLALPLTVLSAPVEDGANLESRARDARWQSIRANLAPGEVVVTGHSLDDLAETVLINLLRGAGSRGLAAMSVSRNGVVRPLTGTSRADLHGVAETLGLPFVDDPANADPRHLRNRIRADLIPLLERDYQPGVRATLGRAASHLAGDDSALQVAARQVPVLEDAGALLLPIPVLVTLPRPVAERAVRRTLRRIHPPYAGKASDVDTVLFVAAGGNRTATLSSGVTVSAEGPYVALWTEAPPVPDAVTLAASGSTRFGEHLVTASRWGAGDPAPISTVVVDRAILESGLIVRAAAPGERIDIAGGTKLVRDALAERGVPVRKRAAWPVLANDAKIAAIAGGRVAPWARPTTAVAVAVTREQA